MFGCTCFYVVIKDLDEGSSKPSKIPWLQSKSAQVSVLAASPDKRDLTRVLRLPCCPST